MGAMSLIEEDLEAARLCLLEVLDACTLRRVKMDLREHRDLHAELRWLIEAISRTRDRRKWIATLSGDARAEATAQTLARAEMLREDSQRLTERLGRIRNRRT